ncbi:hypothetical protein Hdeb2414_s0003g00097171 [Helianthus debilis subsp. tardiflorus]
MCIYFNVLTFKKKLVVISLAPSGLRFIRILGELKGNAADFFLNSQLVKVYTYEIEYSKSGLGSTATCTGLHHMLTFISLVCLF